MENFKKVIRADLEKALLNLLSSDEANQLGEKIKISQVLTGIPAPCNEVEAGKNAPLRLSSGVRKQIANMIEFRIHKALPKISMENLSSSSLAKHQTHLETMRTRFKTFGVIVDKCVIC